VATAAPQARAQILLAARQLLGAASSARLTSVDPATPPTSPASPKKALTALLAGIAGLLLAALVVLIREGTGRRGVKDERELTELETAGFVGSVDTAPRSDPERALPVRSGPQSKAAERYRTVATNMAWLTGRGPLHTLLVVSPDEEAQAGVVAANLAAVLAEANRRVVLVDAAAKQSVSKLFYLDGHPGYGEVLDELADGGRLNGVFDKHLVRCGGALEVLPRGKVNGRALLDAEAMDHVRGRFLEDADVLVVTAPSLTDSPAALAWSRVTDATLVVVNKGRTARANLEQTLDGLTSVGAGQVGTVFVRRPSLRA
jgi:Mrp family chromosome partitioning ATPase